jgi:hypothetical protein
MKTRATEENIVKYLNVLQELKIILDNTNHLSMLKFSEKHNVTKNLSTVLQKGGVIELISRGRFPKWKWTTIQPNKHMALKVLQELSKLNPPRKSKVKKGKTDNATIKLEQKSTINYYEVKVFFGLITFKIKPNLIKH